MSDTAIAPVSDEAVFDMVTEMREAYELRTGQTIDDAEALRAALEMALTTAGLQVVGEPIAFGLTDVRGDDLVEVALSESAFDYMKMPDNDGSPHKVVPLFAAAPDFLAALRKLANEVGGLRVFESELRAELGNTNWNVLMLRLAEADAAILKAEGRAS